MASTRQINDNCYFKTLCDESKAPNNYILDVNASIHNNKCYPNETPINTRSNYKNVNIENNLLNLSTKQSKCIDGNTLNDKRSSMPATNSQMNDCNETIHTQYNRANLNIINRGYDNFNINDHPFNHPHGNNLDHHNSGVYGYSKCKPFNPNDDNSKCYTGNDLQRIGGIDTVLAAKDNYTDKINHYSKMNNINLDENIFDNNVEYDNNNIDMNISSQCKYMCS